MSNRMDQLFKKKLSDHTLTPSPEAWSKIEAGLSKKNKFVIFWRAAAAFIMCGLLVGSWVYFQSKDENQIKQLAVGEKAKVEAATHESGKETRTTENLVKKESTSHSTTVKKREVEVQKKNLIVNTPQLAIIESKPTADIDPKEKETEILEVIEPKTTVAAVKVEKPIVIEFTLDAIPSNQTTVAKVDEVEKTQLKKIWDKALDIKNGETELGGLRMAKNELFALDFRKDKTKRN